MLAAVDAHSATVSWTNINGGSWSVPANWDTHSVPGPSDSVSITAAGTYSVTLDISVTVLGVTLGGPSGQQTLTNATQTISSGAFQVGANGIFGLGGGTLNGGPLTDQGLVALGGGTVAMPINVGGSGTLTFSGPNITIEAAITNAGTTRWTGANASLYVNNNHGSLNGAIYNQPGALFDIQNDQAVYSGGYGFEMFQNAGTLRKSAGTGATTFYVAFTNAGTVDAQSGTIQFAGNGNIGGAYNTASAGIIQFLSGNYVETGTVTNTGTGVFRQNGANVTLNDRITRFILANGNVALSPTFQGSGAIQNLQLDGAYLTGTNRVTGTLGFNGGGMASASPLTVSTAGVLNFNGAAVNIYAPLTNGGTVYWSGSTLSVANNNGYYTGAIYNQPGGLVVLQSDQSAASSGYGFESFNNGGTVRKVAGLGVSTFNIGFTNTGIVDAQAGTIRFVSGGNLGGTYNTAFGGVIEFVGGNYTQVGAPTVTGSGLCRLNGANFTLQDTIANLALSSGNVALSPTFQTNGTIYNLQLAGAYLTGTNSVSGTLSLNGGGIASASPLTVSPGGVLSFTAGASIYSPLTNAGTINWSGGTLSVANNNGYYTGAIYNQPGGIFNLQNDQSLSSAGYGFEFFNNAGTVRKTTGLGVSAFAILFTNVGTVDAQSGTIRFVSGGNIDGSYNTGTGTILEFGGGNYNQTGSPVVTGAGLCRQNGANVTLTDRIKNFILASGNVALSPAFQGSGAIQNLQLDGAYLTGANRVTGMLGFNGGGIASASPLTVTASGMLNLNGNSVNIYAPLTNAGTINWSGGSISLANNAALYTGAIYNQSGGIFIFECDQGVSSAGYGFEMLNNGGTIRKTAGVGTSTISLPFANTGTLDAQSGTIFISGPYTQTGGTMNFGVTSLAYFGHIGFSSVAPLTGTLSVNFNGTYFPSAGDSFSLVTYGSRGGIFTNLALPPQAQWQTNYSASTFNLSILSVTGTGVPVTLTPVSLSAGGFTLAISGPLGPSYIVEGSSDLINWAPLRTNTPVLVPFTVIDTNAGNFTHRYYRAFLGP